MQNLPASGSLVAQILGFKDSKVEMTDQF